MIRRTFSYLHGPLFKKLFTTFVETTYSIWTSNMDTTFEKIYHYSGKCATCSNKIGGLFSSYELLRKAKKTESTIATLKEILRRYHRDIFKHYHSYNNCTLPENFRLRSRPTKKRDYQLVWKAPKDGSRKFFSASKQSKLGMSSQKKSDMPSLSTHLKINWMKHRRICQ